MAMTVELVSPETILWSGEATQVVARTLDGDIAFLDNHAPFVGALDIAEVRIWADADEPVALAVHGGFVEVSHNSVTILSDVAEFSGDIDAERASTAADRAGEALRSDGDDDEAKAALKRATVRLAVAGS
ncbi:MAG: ATP synthase F1 subunit epsilon [Actinomycetota bacterium]|jgi:F-type H+-transporting ATPase subunit epsilon|nr:ATP synthase F1 subunit epsilon [Actinomycetota bacterium]